MIPPLKTLATAAAMMILSGCVVPQGLAYMQENAVAAHRSDIVDRTVARHLHVIAPKLRVGEVDCTHPIRSAAYPVICTLPVDGRTVQIGLRYDEDRGRTIAEPLGAILYKNAESRALVAAAWVTYRVRAAVDCDGPLVQFLPVGSTVGCRLRVAGGAVHRVRLRVVALLTPHVRADAPMPRMVALPALAAETKQLGIDFRKNPRALPGSLIARLLNDTMVPVQRIIQPSVRLGPATCMRHVDSTSTDLPHALTLRCSIDSSAGPFRIAAFTDENHRLRFQNLSQEVDLQSIAKAVGKRDHALVDCGPQRRITLTLLSVHYCQLRFFNGTQSRIGVEYYDSFEGPQVVSEPLAPQG